MHSSIFLHTSDAVNNFNSHSTKLSICDFSSGNTCSVTWSKNAKCGHFAKHYRVNSIEIMVKQCAWGTCRNDSRFPHLQTKNKNGDPITFYHFPAPKRWKETAKRRRQWIIACHRADSFECKKDSYVCSLHFVGQNGPTPEHPDPISGVASKETVCQMYLRGLW